MIEVSGQSALGPIFSTSEYTWIIIILVILVFKKYRVFSRESSVYKAALRYTNFARYIGQRPNQDFKDFNNDPKNRNNALPLIFLIGGIFLVYFIASLLLFFGIVVYTGYF